MPDLETQRTEQREGYTLLYTAEQEAVITQNGLDWLTVTPSSCSCPSFVKRGSCKHLELAFPGARLAPQPRPRATQQARSTPLAAGASLCSPEVLESLAALLSALADLLDPPA